MMTHRLSEHDAFINWTQADLDLACRLKDATDVCQPPPSHLYKPVPWARLGCVLSSGVMSMVFAVWAFFTWIYPPELVREALVHEHRESTLRGDFQNDKQPMLMAMGLRSEAHLPGLLQLQRPCDISGKTAYHVTTFMETGGGIVTILAFAEPLPDAPSGQGQWMGRHWRFVRGTPGKTILMLADNAKVLNITEQLLKNS